MIKVEISRDKDGMWTAMVPALKTFCGASAGSLARVRQGYQFAIEAMAPKRVGEEVRETIEYKALDKKKLAGLKEADRLQKNAEKEQAKATEIRRRVARHFRGQGYSVRDVGSVMGISSARVQQLSAEE